MAEPKAPAKAFALPEDNRLIVRPIITEKATLAREAFGKYTFEVTDRASKKAVQRAIERMFSVKVRKVNLVRRHGKMRRVRMRPGWTNDTKRAVVTIEPGQKIAFFEGI